MQQVVAHSRAGCNPRCALKGSGEMTLIVHIDIEDGSPLSQCRILSGVPEQMELLFRYT